MSNHLFHLKHIHSILQRELSAKERELDTLPKGSLYLKTRKNGKSLCWKQESSQSSSGKRVEKILDESHRSIAEGVRRRHFLEKQIPKLRKNLEGLSNCISQYHACSDHEIRKILPPVYTEPLSYNGFQKPDDLLSSSPQTLFPEGLIHKNSVDERFRSKSEVQISEILRSLNLTYYYEPRITLGEKTICPDFQVIHPLSGEIIYIEYFGIVDNNEYGLRMLEKIRLYLNHGYIPGRNILFIFETPSSGMDLSAAHALIKQLIS